MTLGCISRQHKEFFHDPLIYRRVRSESRHAHNSSIDQCAVHECGIFSDGKILPHILDGGLCSVDGREGSVEGEVELLLAPCLTVLQPRELVPVPEEEFQLEPRPVDGDAVLCAHLRVGGEEELVSSSILVHTFQSLGVPDDQPDVPLEALDIRQEGVELPLVHAAELVHALHSAEVGGHGVEFSVVLLRCASLPRPLARVEITQDSVLPEPAGHGESHEDDGGDDQLRGVKRVGHKVLRDPQEPFLVLLDGSDVPAVEVHGLAILPGMFPKPPRARRLHGPERHAVAGRGVDDAYACYLKPGLDGLVAARPVPAHAPCALARLGDVALVHADGQHIAGLGEPLPDEGHVVSCPVHRPLVVVAVGLLAVRAVLPHLGEIDFFD